MGLITESNVRLPLTKMEEGNKKELVKVLKKQKLI